MSSKKIIFLITTLIILLWLAYSVWKISKSGGTKTWALTGSLSIWVVGDTTSGYDSLIEWFRISAPEYKNTKIEFKKFKNTESYQKILLSTLADGNGPDIFTVEAGSDSILKDKIEPIPSEYINITDFDKRFEDLFLPLIESSWSADTLKTFLRWVPLWYETLAMFYNKSLLLTLPTTWNEVSTLYIDGKNPSIFPTNIGMSPRYTPYALDIIALFWLQSGVDGFGSIEKWSDALANYESYGNTRVLWWESEGDTVSGSQNQTLWEKESTLSETKLTTIDLFIRGEIAMVIWYPSLVKDIEDAKKRAGNLAINSIVLTERIPQESPSVRSVNLARYSYFWLSKSSQNAKLWAKFLSYLLTEDAEKRFIWSFPLYIPAQRSFYEIAKTTALSPIFSRARLDSFIPNEGQIVHIFDYGNKIVFEKILADNIDRTGKIDKNNIITVVTQQIGCEVHGLASSQKSDPCHE